jgi:hypothetical protein
LKGSLADFVHETAVVDGVLNDSKCVPHDAHAVLDSSRRNVRIVRFR